MLWIMAIIIGGVLAGIKIRKYCKGDVSEFPTLGAICIIITIISMFIFIAQGITGITDYPYLTRKLAQVESLNHRIQDIKNASYKYKKDGNFVAGSIENINQSTNLSKYIADLAQKEAHYSGYLKEAKAYKETFVLYFFGNGWAISDKIYDLPTIKTD